MPTEMRHVFFKQQEILLAIRDYYRRLGQHLPSGRVVSSIVECDKAGGILNYHIKVTLPDKLVRTIVMESHVLAAALMLFCRDKRIPLPVRAEKSLRYIGEQVCLLVHVKTKAAQDSLEELRL